MEDCPGMISSSRLVFFFVFCFFSIPYLMSIEMIFTIYNFIYMV